MTTSNWMIYGANGYTGHLLAAEAQRQGLTPILAGRNPAAVHALGSLLGLECRIFDIAQPERAREALADVALVVHCAGPFSATSAPMLDACLASATHYVDITGEIGVFEAAHGRDRQAREAGLVVCPGVGFDVIPSDCLAACLHQALPDASHLALGFDTASGLSPGTAKTLVEGFKLGGKVRRAGIITDVPLGYRRRQIDFGRGEKSAVSIPWGDVATAYYSTGIDNIEVYLSAPTALAIGMRLVDPLRPLLGLDGVQHWLKRLVDRRVSGPDQASREQQRTWLWGEVRNAAGQMKTAHLETANGYQVTVHGALLAVGHLLAYSGPGGYFTPSRLFGERCVEQLPGSGKIIIA
ncbi:saccharopine dehydrogenase NADP-binding domain-containing protein [Pseudomonas sp. SA3-5]|uniref:Saccharopine dehydrogenase NADP-binding domain-containing protein n=1 Tax=Pseudomonas aestuarii TaxID=3018340 RepID=A0ABT4XAV9_9PSED|nr:saccharopine dehydrogenase NADP-binding domain-containing protein [Pseudomonas aestuarii]MDA7085313.1 saccharopine dehydrogenase NADP-binding domain-containing protein [Pseudomonas aestuarii]